MDLKEIIIKLSNESGFAPILLEKDYHLTRILHKISERKIKDLTFKGGTCLNKCYLGFHRLSEDLDFVFNQDVKDLSKSQIRKILNELKKEFFIILGELGLEINNELGNGWKMLTSKKDPKIVGLEIITKYNSLIDNSIQTIKIETSFRNKLINLTKTRQIHHEFIDVLGQPILKENVQIEVIDLIENFAEKFRALVTRKNIAIRDIYDIHFILNKKILKIDKRIIELSLIKIRESMGPEFTEKDLIDFIKNLDSKTLGLNEKEISAVLKSEEKLDIRKMVDLIVRSFINSLDDLKNKG